MKFRSLFQKICLIVLCLSSLSTGAFAQRPGSSEPREEKLLNGLKVLMWTDPAATDVRVSIRVHSGSSFDPQGKEGVMKLLAENIFPTPASREFYSEDLGGDVEVISNYDFIQINARAKASEFVPLIESLAQAISLPTIDKDTTNALKKALTERLTELHKDPAYVAEHAATKRLFGTFPYGRPQLGTVESLQRIDFADLISAKERFLSPDNTTVAISGNFNTDLGFRAARRYLGAWIKSDKRVPSTFRQPDDPDTKPVELTVDGGSVRTSFAFRGLARNDPDYAAALVLENALRGRFAKGTTAMSFSHHARVLPGVVTVGANGSPGFPFALFTDRITDAEFAKSKAEVTAEFAKRSLADQWLDADTYRIKVAEDSKAVQNVTAADVQRVAERLAKNPIVSVVVKPAAPAN